MNIYDQNHFPVSSLPETNVTLISSTPPNFKEKNKAFSVVLFIELWERFGYYGMQSVLVLFLIDKMHFMDKEANLLMGAFAAMTYAASVLGGWIGDRITGNRRAMLCGSVILALGYLLLSQTTHYITGIYITMAIISTGNGLFKPNAATLVRRIYNQDNSQLDIAFTLYYMAVNVGSTVSMLICPILKDHYGWPSAFIGCCIGLALGIVNYFLTCHRLDPYLPEKDKSNLSWASSGLIFSGVILCILCITFILRHQTVTFLCIWGTALLILILWILIYTRTEARHRYGLKIMYILTLEGMLYFIFYQQMSTSLTLFAQRNINPSFYLGSYHLFDWSAGQFQALNPIFIMVLSPILTKLYKLQNQYHHDFSIATKFVFGFSFITIAFFLWWMGCLTSHTTHLSSWIMVYGYFFLSLGELLTSGLGLAVIARYIPSSINGFMTGSYFMASGISLYLGSKIANIAAPKTLDTISDQITLSLYQTLFLDLFIAAIIVLILLLVLLPFIRKLDKAHHKLQSE